MTLNRHDICILRVPVAGIAAVEAASARQFVLGNDELVRLAGADHELALAAVPDLAYSKKPWRRPSTTTFSRCASASANWLSAAPATLAVVMSCIVQQRLHVFDG